MKSSIVLILSLLVSVVSVATVQSRINFGGGGGGFTVGNAARLDLGSAVLADGVLINAGGVLAGTPHCTNMCIQTALISRTSMVTDGIVDFSSHIQLGDNQKLCINGDTINESLKVSGANTGTPSILYGSGGTIAEINIDSLCALRVNLSGTLNSEIWFETLSAESASLLLDSDLIFNTGCCVQADTPANAINTVAFNGHCMAIGGTEDSLLYIYGPMTFTDANVQITGPVMLAADDVITLSGNAKFSGQGNRFYFGEGAIIDNGGYDVHMTDLIFENVSGVSFAGVGNWIFDNCILNGVAGGSVTITGTLAGSFDLFGGDVVFRRGTMTLNENLGLEGEWSLGTTDGDDVITINGQTFRLDMLAGSFTIAATGTLALCDLLWDHVSSSSVADVASVLVLSGVTMVLVESINWSLSGQVVQIAGSTTIITGDYSFTVNAGSEILSNITLWYDTLGTNDATNVAGFGGLGRVTRVASGEDVAVINGYIGTIFGDLGGISGELSVIDSTLSSMNTSISNLEDVVSVSNYTITSASTPCGLERNIYLYPEIVDDGIAGASLTFNGGDSFSFDGYGRTIFFSGGGQAGIYPNLMTIALDTTVELRRIVLDGIKNNFYTVAGQLYFGSDTLVRLHNDWIGIDALNKTLHFGSAVGAGGCKATLDLNGCTIDMAHENALIVLDNSLSSELRIKNGRLINLSGRKLKAGYNCTIILDSVDLELSDDFTWSSVDSEDSAYFSGLVIEGTCSISGPAGTVFSNCSTNTFTIASMATLTLHDGIVYSHDNDGIDNFAMTDKTSILELMGAKFRRSNQSAIDAPSLILTNGTVIVDQKSYLVPGDHGMIIGYATGFPETSTTLDLIVRPGGLLFVGSDGVASAGTVTYQNPA